MKVAVVGGGIAGVGAALLLRRRGVECDLFEASARPGGLLAPIEFAGVLCDRGSHRVHPDADPILFSLCSDVTWERRARRGVIVLGGRRVPYPLDPLRFARALGWTTSARMALSWAQLPARLRALRTWERDRTSDDGDDDEGFEAFVRARVGDLAYERFYEPYARKLWGVAPGELSRTTARLRVSTGSPLRSLSGGALAEEFLYPRGGMAALFGALLSSLERLGGRVHLGRAATPATLDADRVIYTGHLSSLCPRAGLTHRGLYIVHLAFASGVLGEVDTWYTPDARYYFGRVSRPALFSSSQRAREGEVLAVEIPEGAWGPERDFTRALDPLLDQLRDAGIVGRHARPFEVRQTFVPGVYPLYLRGWKRRWEGALRQVVRAGVIPTGRQGLFLHCNLDHALRAAAEAAEHAMNGSPPEAWIAQAERLQRLRVRD